VEVECAILTDAVGPFFGAVMHAGSGFHCFTCMTLRALTLLRATA